MPVSFDTHQFITRLIQGQMSLEQAEAVSAALQEALESSLGHLATTDDLASLGTALRQDTERLGTALRQDITHLSTSLRQEIAHLTTRMTWMIGIYGGITMLILGKLLLFK